MSLHLPTIDDRQLLKLLATGLGESAAAKQMGIPCNAVTDRVKQYLACGILQANGGQDVVNWKAFGRWRRGRRQTSEAA